jgi:hypothetical protein
MWVWRSERDRVVRPVRRRAEMSPWAVAVVVVVVRKSVRVVSGRYFRATATRSERESCGMCTTLDQSPVMK